VRSIRRMKFSSPVLPDSRVNLKMEFDAQKNSVSFCMKDAAKNERIFSQGAFGVCK
jgi:3-hydroxymyristoyl/3-hydroxydecanoyl-(acyl carrier protein) dehydratase